MRNFAWNALSNILAVKERLIIRKSVPSSTCDRCNSVPETLTHACFFCPAMSHLWADSSLSTVLNQGRDDSFFDLTLSTLQTLGSDGFHDLLLFAWAAWNSRNLFQFSNKEGMESHCFEGLTRFVGEYKIRNTISSHSQVSPSHPSSWIPPSHGVLKVNTDASLLYPGVIGLGVVIRDSYGFIFAAAVRRIHAGWNVELAEAMGIQFGLATARNLGITSVWAESDSLGVVLGVQNLRGNNTYVGGVLDDIRHLLSCFDSARLTFVKKGGNCAAHYMARLLPSEEGDILYSGDFPSGLTDVTELDIT